MQNRCFSVGIIGAGDIAAKVHLPVLLAMKNVAVAWIADVDVCKAKSLARAYRVRHCELPQDLAKLPYTDLVLLAIPYGARDPYYVALRERQSALYVEKPFSRCVDHHRRICSWFPDYRITSGLHKRSYALTQLMKQVIESELYGPLVHIRYGFGGLGAVHSGSYSSNIQLAGGGALFDNGIYGIDALLFCTSTAAVEIRSATMIMDGGFDLHTSATLLLTTSRGETIDCELTVSCLQDTINCLEFTFEHAVVPWSLFTGEGVIVKPLVGGQSFILSPAGPLYPVTAYETYYEFWCRFIAGLSEERANWTSAAQSILTTELVEGLYRAGHDLRSPSGTP